MKNQIITIATSIVLVFSFASCTDDTKAFIQKIEATQTELKQQDSILVTYRSELSSLAFTDTTKTSSPNDSLLNKLSQKINPLITRLELMIEKNKALVEQVKSNSGDSKQVEKDYTTQLDELELIKVEIVIAKTDYEKIVSEADEVFKSPVDSAKVE